MSDHSQPAVQLDTGNRRDQWKSASHFAAWLSGRHARRMAATIFEGEAELAVVIGKRASHVKATNAMSYVFGYTNFIDGSARGVVPPTNVFYQMKSRDTFAPA
jgi:2-keto-4-pentenoate hydratase/2-oxohepta-3-ene-1,7-dioic acid hydratase in catechol pathway